MAFVRAVAANQRAWALELSLLLASPLAAAAVLGFTGMVTAFSIDPTFFTAYAQHGPDLVQRYGTDNYYWVRAGFILPARLSYLAFGAVGGFLVFRYVLALVAVLPVYLLFRRLRGRLAGATAVVIVLTNPVVLTAWGTDYPNSAAASYLFVGLAALFMPPRSSRERFIWLFVAGAAFTLAVHSHAVTGLLVVAAVAAYGIVHLRPRRLASVGHVGLLAVVALAVTGVLMLVARIVFRSSDLIGPTVDAMRTLRSPAEVVKWHSPNWRWVLDAPYLLVPVAALLAWAARNLVRRRSGHRPSLEETGVIVAAFLQLAIYAGWQFFNEASTLEYYLYSSMLWPAACLVAAFVVSDLLLTVPRTVHWRWAPLGLLVVIPLVLSIYDESIRFAVLPTGVALALVVVAAATFGARWLVPWGALGGAAVVIGALFALTIGKDVDKPILDGQVGFPEPYYGKVIWTDNRKLLREYELVSEVPELVPSPRASGDLLLNWWPNRAGEIANKAAAQYLWHQNTVGATMPELTPEEVTALRERRPSTVLLLSDTGHELAAAQATLAESGFRFRVVEDEALRSGHAQLHVQVLTLDWS